MHYGRVSWIWLESTVIDMLEVLDIDGWVVVVYLPNKTTRFRPYHCGAALSGVGDDDISFGLAGLGGFGNPSGNGRGSRGSPGASIRHDDGEGGLLGDDEY